MIIFQLFTVKINLTVPSKPISTLTSSSLIQSSTKFSNTSIVIHSTALSDASVASTMKTAASFSDIIHVVILSIVSVLNIFLVGLLIELIVRLKVLICLYNNFF